MENIVWGLNKITKHIKKKKKNMPDKNINLGANDEVH
jgi:hypothetical protein